MLSRTWKTRAANRSTPSSALTTIVLDRQRINYFPASESDHSLGGLDFTNWVVELAKQEQELSVFFDIVIVCSVTNSFHAGIIVGTVAEGRKRKI